MDVATSPCSILVVEDNPDLVIGLLDLLRHDGYAVTSTGTVAGAIELVRARQFNAILLDLGLPDGDGLEVLKETQRQDPSLPVVIVTAHISQDRTVGSLTEGAFAYLTKPYHREELRQTLRRAIDAKELAIKAKHAEHRLTESEERFRSLVESASDAIVVSDRHGLIVSWNRSAATLFGYTDQEAIGRALTILMPERYHLAHREGLARMESAGVGRVIGSVVELHGLKRDGTEFPIELSLATWSTVTGNFYSGIIRDLTERKKTDDALRRSNQLLKHIVDNTTAVIYVKDPDGRYLLANRQFERIFHLTADQIIGHTDHDILPRESADAFRANDLAVLAQDRTVEYEETAPLPDGPHTYISIKFPLRDQTGIPYATCGISTDITDRKRIEHNLRAHEEQLRHTLASTAAGGWDWDCQTGRFCWSQQVDSLLGVTDGLKPRSREEWLNLIHPDDRHTVAQAMDRAIEQPGAELMLEHRVIRQDGTSQWFVWTGQILRDHTGKAVHLLGMVRAAQTVKQDVHEQRHRTV
ncbi:MAG: PAS domain S-box protein [Nitrospira sp.]|nr:PAS domain S-box protein [Nitrospira sp.]